MNLGTTRLRGRPRNRWQDEVREDVRVAGGEGWQGKYLTERNGRSCWERQGIVTFCTWQWDDWMNEFSWSPSVWWMYIQSVINMDCIKLMYKCYIIDMSSTFIYYNLFTKIIRGVFRLDMSFSCWFSGIRVPFCVVLRLSSIYWVYQRTTLGFL